MYTLSNTMSSKLYRVAGLPLALFACFSPVNSKLNIKLEMANRNCKGRICDANSGFWGGGRKKEKKIKYPDFQNVHVIPLSV